jgi:ATP-dependent DNA helicase RecG
MTTNQPLSLFISSKMQELLDERQAVQAALKEYDMYGWLWEKDAGARPEPIDSTYLKEVEACDIYIGLFWLGYGPYTIEEYEHARKHQKPCLIYKKQVDIAKRDPQLKAFLAELERVKNPEGLTVYRFETADELAAQVKKDVIRLLTTRFRESRQQPAVPPAPPDSVTLTADRGGIAVYNNTGTITQHTHNYGRPEDKR